MEKRHESEPEPEPEPELADEIPRHPDQGLQELQELLKVHAEWIPTSSVASEELGAHVPDKFFQGDFKKHLSFCRGIYRGWNLLPPDEDFKDEPSCIFATERDGKTVSTIAVFTKQDDTEKLPLQAAAPDLVVGKSALELGRFAIDLALVRTADAEIVTQKVVEELFMFLESYKNNTDFDGDVFIYTFDLIIKFMKKIFPPDTFILQETEIKQGVYPKAFEDMNPQIYKLNPQAVQAETEKTIAKRQAEKFAHSVCDIVDDVNGYITLMMQNPRWFDRGKKVIKDAQIAQNKSPFLDAKDALTASALDVLSKAERSLNASNAREN